MDQSAVDQMNAIFHFQWPKPNWDHWQDQTKVRLWEAAALVFDIDPKSLTEVFLPSPPSAYDDLKRMAVTTLPLNGLVLPNELDRQNAENSPANLARFGVWAARIGYPLPAKFPRQVTDEAIKAYGWPWGTHSTWLLERMAEAASRYWARYDPSDPTTAPTNPDVEAYLMELEVPKRTAEIMATILRCDDLPQGRRKKS